MGENTDTPVCYSSCGFLGFNRKRFDASSLGGPNTRFEDGRYVSTVDATSDNASLGGAHTRFEDGRYVSTIECGPGTVLRDETCQVVDLGYDSFTYDRRLTGQTAMYEDLRGRSSRQHIAMGISGTPDEILMRCAKICDGEDSSLKVSGCTAFEYRPMADYPRATCYYYEDNSPSDRLIPNDLASSRSESSYFVRKPKA